jgi:hypothetical protein
LRPHVNGKPGWPEPGPAGQVEALLLQGLFQCVQHEARMCRPRHAPADDPESVGVAAGSSSNGFFTEDGPISCICLVNF